MRRNNAGAFSARREPASPAPLLSVDLCDFVVMACSVFPASWTLSKALSLILFRQLVNDQNLPRLSISGTAANPPKSMIERTCQDCENRPEDFLATRRQFLNRLGLGFG